MFTKASKGIAYSLLLIFAVLPLLAGFSYATLYSFGIVGALNKGFTLAYWQQMLGDKYVWLSFAYTLALALASLGLCIAIALYFAINYAHKFKNGFFSYLVYMPLAFPTVVASFFFFQLLSGTGLLSRICFKLGLISSIEQFPALVNDPYSIGIVLAQTFLSLPIFILLYINLYQSENLASYTALGLTLGASKRAANYKIALPILLQKSAANIILYLIFKLGSYEIPLILGRSSPETISVMAVRKLQKFDLNDIPQGYALASLYTLLVLILLALVAKTNKRAYAV